MKLSINFRQMSGRSETIDYIDRRVSFALARTKHAIQSTAVTVSDINGPRGGVDKQCLVVIKPYGLPSIVVSEQHNSLQLAIGRSIARASQSLLRKLKRKQVIPRRIAKLKPAPSDDQTNQTTENEEQTPTIPTTERSLYGHHQENSPPTMTY